MRIAAVLLLAAVLTLRTPSAIGATSTEASNPTEASSAEVCNPIDDPADPIARELLTNCQTDSDCVVADVTCCPCWAGGTQGAIRNDKQLDLMLLLAECCQGVDPALDCIYVGNGNCQNVGASCQGGTCTLVTIPPTPTPTPTFAAIPTPTGTQAAHLCSGGARDGQACQAQTDCTNGVCVIAQGVCDDLDGFPCDCGGGSCSSQNTCVGGASAGGSCDTTANCAAGVSCIGSQKVCVGNGIKDSLPAGFSCLFDGQCNSSECRSTGMVCGLGSDFAGFSCGQDADCCVTGGTTCPQGGCGSVLRTLPTSTPTLVLPPSTPTPIGCVSDCNGDGQVTADEIVTSVNIALSGNVTACPAFDCCPKCDQPGIEIDCLVTAVNNALNGCLVWRPACGPPIVDGVQPCVPPVTLCTADESFGRGCDSPGATCCPAGALCDPSGQFCNFPLVCDIRPPLHCPLLRDGGSPGS